MSRLRPVVTNSSFVAPAYDAATAVATEDIGNINAEFDFPGETEASCNSNERIGVADGVESEGACVDNAAIHNSTEFSPVLDGAAASSFEGPSFEQGLNPHSLRGSADSLINAVAATRAGIGAVRYDTVVNDLIMPSMRVGGLTFSLLFFPCLVYFAARCLESPSRRSI